MHKEPVITTITTVSTASNHRTIRYEVNTRWDAEIIARVWAKIDTTTKHDIHKAFDSHLHGTRLARFFENCGGAWQDPTAKSAVAEPKEEVEVIDF